ncbi:MAG: dTDP-4-dehydrorhamnose reductase [Proteobacteria bacterium]|nr:dTDP-4-dehydrorhamnose reductase [Pseudomonadota bacterium]MBU1686564.1 dTDP-4-dehydrorhamnose reductase [Pseudomonadota bacterium]
MKVLIVGAAGQLGMELQKTVPLGVEVVACGSREMDITDRLLLMEQVKSIGPDLIINAAAYTKVDQAESDVDQAHAVNELGAGYLAEAALAIEAELFHISTDFVFDGTQSVPYLPADRPNPQSIYGVSKAAGERRVMAIMSGRALIVRTAWVYAASGHNFVRTMLRLLAEKDQIGVIAEQVGTPTWARSLALALWGFRDRKATGIYHFTDAGVASWYDFAMAVYEEARELDLVQREVAIRPLRTVDYPLPAKRPQYSILDKTSTWQLLDIPPVHWRVCLRKMLREMKDGHDA